jgi:hypothetical protein
MIPTGPTRLTTALPIVVAFLKVYFTGNEFTELHRVSRPRRAGFSAWVAAASAATGAPYVL